MRGTSLRRVLVSAIGSTVALLGAAAPALAQSAQPAQPAAPAQPAPPQPAATGVVQGVVVIETSDGKEPVPGATVLVTGGPTVMADAEGRFQLELPPGDYRILAQGDGSSSPESAIAVTAGVAATVELVVTAAPAEVISIVGSRTPRSQLETPVPVDIITADAIAESGHTETNQLLHALAPSFNATHLSIADGTDHIDPASLRGLGPEHVLVLVNGRRLHQTALVNIYNGGTVGVDLNAIPTAAIERIEVLRDGAASQYGSDAIAGVINIVLRDGVDLVHLYSMTGITASNDGAQVKLGGHTGVALGDRGFLTLTGEFFGRQRTNRTEPWPDDIFPGIEGREATDAELARRGLTRREFTMVVGQSGALVGTTFLNAGYRLGSLELYGNAGYTYRRGYASGFYRLPSQENRVDLRVYPNGFLPEINPRMHAWTATAGARGSRGKWRGDVSLTHGGDSFRFLVENSLNASLGTESPTEFDAGRLHYHQTSLNVDVVRPLELSAIPALSLVLGAEARNENYGIDAGQPESYELGPVRNSMGEPKAPGSQVFPGFRPTDESDESRQSVAAYAGVESKLTERLSLDVGGRVESYSDFGSTAIGKIAGRVALVSSSEHDVALRGAASTGFRAPGLQQLWYSTIATQFFNDPMTGLPTPTEFLVSPNRSPVAESFGVPRLKEETSRNFSAGFTARLFGNLSVSADYYRVAIDDRVVLSGVFDVSDGTIGSIIEDVVAPFPNVAAVQFYVNAVDTTTNGVDLVLDYSHRLPGGSLRATAAANITRTTVDQVSVPRSMEERFSAVPGGAERVREIFLGRYGKNLLEDLLPQEKGTLGLRYDRGPLSLGARANYFGATVYRSDTQVDGEYLDESFSSEVTFDLDVGYRVGGLWWSVGANNAFNNFPDEVQRPENRNSDSFLYTPAAFSGGAPYGTAGAFYYARVEYRY